MRSEDILKEVLQEELRADVGPTKLNILFLDIETAPNLGWVWGKYEQDVISFEKERYMLCFAAKWLGDKKIDTWGLPDFPGYTKNKEDDHALVMKLREYLDKADIVVGQNIDKFDIRIINTRLAVNDIAPPSPYKTVDTLKAAKKFFGFNSNKLNDLGVSLGLGEKADTGGFKLWMGCIEGNKKAWDKMKKYNKQDIVLLEAVYYKLRPWMNSHPNTSTSTDGSHCPTCGSHAVQHRGYSYNRLGIMRRLFCKNCGSWYQLRNHGRS